MPSAIPVVSAPSSSSVPEWAFRERELFDLLDRAVEPYLDRYVRSDGTLRFRSEWPGIDGADDAYEAFVKFPVLYLLGGSSRLLELARREWEAITWQWTQYGQIHREFNAGYDWMHHGEAYNYLFYLALADPSSLIDLQRARHFADMYIGADPQAPNYDPERRLIRSPLTGSRGPRTTTEWADWVPMRKLLGHPYPSPFEDAAGVAGPAADWTDDGVYAELLRLMNERMVQGDVPLNLTAAALVTHAHVFTGDPRYRDWVLEYFEAWTQRCRDNGGILPDNVGLDGRIGSCMGGNWWGGYYGWQWPHGALTIVEPVLVAGASAALMTGDLAALDLVRSQLDLLHSLGRQDGSTWVVPHRHTNSGWGDYRPLDPSYAIHCWNLSLDTADLERALRGGAALAPVRELAKNEGFGWHTAHWFEYVTGRRDDYPLQILEANRRTAVRKLHELAHDPADLTRNDVAADALDVHHWQNHCPLRTEALVQLTTGAPMAVYHGGLPHGSVRHFDAQRRRAGLPDSVGALVERIDSDGIVLALANVSPVAARELVVQAGMFGEHRFDHVAVLDAEGDLAGAAPRTVAHKWLRVELAPMSTVRLRLGMTRHALPATYETPWSGPADPSLLPNGPAPQ